MLDMDEVVREVGGVMCYHCRHYDPSKPFRCEAFPKEIPDHVWYGTHTEPFPGDNGILFEELSEEELQERMKETDIRAGAAAAH